MRKAWLLSMLAVALLAPANALAQSDPFSPVPQAPQTPQTPELPEPQAPDDEAEDDGLGGTAFWLIIGSTGVLFVGIAALITRDMRKTAGTRRKPRRTRGTGRPAADAADAIAAESGQRSGSQRARAKAQQRAKVKAARKQRRKSRSR